MKKIIRNICMEIFSAFLSSLSLMIPKQKNLILFGAFAGEKFGDNSGVLFTYIQKNHPEFLIFWMTNNNSVYKNLKKKNGNVLKRHSIKGILYSLKANLIVTSHGIKDSIMFIPIAHKPKMLYLHHGIPMRKGWLEIENTQEKNLKSTKSKISCSDFMIAPSIYAAKLQNKLIPIGIQKFKITGLPRNDLLFEKNDKEKNIINKFDLNNFDFLILYAPTWREWEPTKYFPFADWDLAEIEKFLEIKNICIIIRPHHIDYGKQENEIFLKEISKFSNLRIVTHADCPDINHLCRISHCLITDYSSLFFDYLLLDKPVMFLPYDLEIYEKRIGLYIDFEKIAIGPKPKSQQEFLIQLDRLVNNDDQYKFQRQELKNKFHKFQDGNSCKRVVKLLKEMMK